MKIMRLLVNLTLVSQFLLPIAFESQVFAGDGAVVACDGAGSDNSRACIQAPAGIISKSTKAKDFITTLNWMLLAASIVSCVMFLLKCSARLSDEQYKEAIGPGIGSGLAALSMYIAYQLLS